MLFPHQKLDWSLRRLEKRVEDVPDDAAARVEFATASLSKAMFHEGGEPYYNKALTQARRVLQGDSSNISALVAAGVALVELDRLDAGERPIDDAFKLAPERADVRFARALFEEARGDVRAAIREAEASCRASPEDWEPHHLLARLLGRAADHPQANPRLVERSQFHGVMALMRDPSPTVTPDLLHDLGTSLLRGGRTNDAQKVFQRLLDHEKYRAKARYYLGLALYQAGKYKNAIVFLRQHLDERPDAAHVWTRVGMAFLQLGEVDKAREACNRALALEPGDLLARFTLASTLLQEGQTDEAVRVFREILADAPDHVGAFAELVRLRARDRDARWLAQAVRAEVSVHDRLPISASRDATAPVSLDRPSPMKDRRRQSTIQITPRKTTRDRIATALKALSDIGATEEIGTILGAMDLTTDEGLRFQLWEAALDQMARRRAADVAAKLDAAGANYSSAAGREALLLAAGLPEALLPKGLAIAEEDLKRAAVDRYGPASDVNVHRVNVDRERQEARGWQALLLLAIATRPSPATRNLLVRWASDADPDLQYAAKAALVVQGDLAMADELRDRAQARGADALVDELLAAVAPVVSRTRPRPVGGDEGIACSTCGRRAPEANHLLAGGQAAVCDRCLAAIAKDRRELQTDDPAVSCSLCGKTVLEVRGVFVLRGTPVCAECVDQGLGLVEREEIDRYLGAF